MDSICVMSDQNTPNYLVFTVFPCKTPFFASVSLNSALENQKFNGLIGTDTDKFDKSMFCSYAWQRHNNVTSLFWNLNHITPLFENAK